MNMNKRSVLRTLLAAAVFTLMMSIGVWAEAYGPNIQLSTSVLDTDVVATDSTMLHRLEVPSDGVVSFTGVEYSSYSNNKYGLSFSLLSSSFTPINRYGSSSTYVNGTDVNSSSFSREYALKRGTYFIRVTNTKYYTIRTLFTAANDQGGLSKKKAATLKRKAQKSCVFGAGETYDKAEWFKINLTKPRKLTLEVTAHGDASYRVTFSGPKPYKKGDVSYVSSGNVMTAKYWIRRGRKKLKLKKGKYYVKIQRRSNDVSGYCTVKWW